MSGPTAFWAVFLLCSLMTPSQVVGVTALINQANLDGKLQNLQESLLDSIQPGSLLESIQPSSLLESIQPGSLLESIQPGRLLDNIQPGRLLDSIQPGRLLDSIQPGRLLDSIQPGRLLDGIQPGRLLDSIQPGRLLDVVGSLTAGVSGGDGVLGILLGKEGLVDNLLRTVSNILVGKGGLLGKDGLVGNLLGGNGEDLPGAKILNNTLPKISLHSLPGFGHQVNFNTQLLVKSTSVPGSPLCVQVEADVTMLVQHQRAAPQNNKDCKVVDIKISLRPNVPLLEQPLKRFLSGSLSKVACSIINVSLNMVNTLTGSRPSSLPVGAVGDLPPFSIINGESIQLDLNPLIGDVESRVAASTQGPLNANLLLATGLPPQISLSQQVLSNLLETVQGQGALNLNITNSMVPNSILLSTSALLPFIPQLARILPSSMPLELRVQVPSEPVVDVNGRRATATLRATIDIFSPLTQSSQKPLISFDTDIVLNIIPLVSDGKLQTSLALDSINLTRASLRLSPRSVSALTGWLQQVFGAAYVPAINDVLSLSIPLPNNLNASFRNAIVDITNADNSPDTDLKKFC